MALNGSAQFGGIFNAEVFEISGDIILVTDGSAGARPAEDMAVDLAVRWRVPLRVAYILDESWGSILGDEWMSSSETRMDFYNWLEGGLLKQADDVLEKVAGRAGNAGVKTVKTEIISGPTEKVITELTESGATLLLVLPHPEATAPRAEAGLKFNLQSISRKIKCPLLVGPSAAR